MKKRTAVQSPSSDLGASQRTVLLKHATAKAAKQTLKKVASYTGKACFRCKCEDHYAEDCVLPESDMIMFLAAQLPSMDATTAPATNVNLRGMPRDPNGLPADKSIVYCGRRLCMGGWDLPQSVLANMFYMTNDAYEQYILHTPELKKLMIFLKGQRLGCWCKPEPCHTDVLVKLANNK
jgi:hypothetical protein